MMGLGTLLSDRVRRMPSHSTVCFLELTSIFPTSLCAEPATVSLRFFYSFLPSLPMEQREQSNRPRETSLDPDGSGQWIADKESQSVSSRQEGSQRPRCCLRPCSSGGVARGGGRILCGWSLPVGKRGSGQAPWRFPQCLLEQNFRQIPFWKASGLLHLADETLRSGRPHHLDTPCPSDSNRVGGWTSDLLGSSSMGSSPFW